jgi:lysophospholipase L1-like esterase
MSRRSITAAVLAVLSVAVALVAFRPSASSAAVPLRIMPLGDSITAGPGCWRALLWNRLQANGFTDIDFVGTQPGGGCPGPAYDVDHEGHGGFSATGIADQNQLPPWLSATSPDIVMMHLGTNDTWGGHIPLSAKLAAYTKLVGQMRANNPAMKIIVAQIIPMNPPGCATCAPDVVALNNAIPGWAAGLRTAQSPIHVADLWTGFNTATDTFDGVHPTAAGFQKMSDRWYPTLAAVLGGGTPSQPVTRSSSPRPSSSSAPATPGTCTATYRVGSQWPGGFQGAVTVTNSGATTSTGWSATFTFTGGQQITQAWDAAVTQTGASVVAANMPYNNRLPAGDSATFGFVANWNNTANPVPPVTCVLR